MLRMVVCLLLREFCWADEFGIHRGGVPGAVRVVIPSIWYFCRLGPATRVKVITFAGSMCSSRQSSRPASC